MSDTAVPESRTTYTAYAVFARRAAIGVDADRLTTALVGDLANSGVTVRGFYDVKGMPATADLLVWLHGESASALQEAIRRFQNEALGGAVALVWSGFGVHPRAEVGRDRGPAFLRGEEPLRWLTVYPFVSSYEWYRLPEDERRTLIAEADALGRDFPRVLSNTVAAFALGDDEWLVALEAEQLVDLTALTRQLRATAARSRIRIDTTVFVGHRIGPADLARVLR